jgi:hypothetical protein
MKVSIAEVVNVDQISTTFKFLARVQILGNQNREISYTSPYFGNGGSGFVALPTVGQTILVVQPEDRETFYYIGSVLEDLTDETDNPIVLSEELKSPSDKVDDQVYKARGVPQRLVFKDPLGNKVVLSNEYNPEYYNTKLQLKSVAGKELSLIDSPLVNSVILKNEHGDGITITSSDTVVDGPRLLKTYANKGQEHRSSNGRYLVHLLDGLELTIANTSTGINKEPANDLYGNVNIESRNKDVNIYSRSQSTGKIHIECTEQNASQVIQIRTRANTSVVRVDSEGKIEIRSGNNLDIVVGGDLNLKIGGKLSIDAGGGIDMQSGGEINLDGASIDLNSGLASPNAPSIASIDSAYPIQVET